MTRGRHASSAHTASARARGREGREQGSRDWRLLPVAACVWAATLACPYAMRAVRDAWGGAASDVPASVPVIIVPVVAVIVIAGMCLAAAVAHRLRYALVVATAVLAAFLSVQMHEALAAHDVAAWALEQGTSSVVAEVRIRAPATGSDRRDAQCRVEARLMTLTVHGVTAASGADTRVYASGAACALHQGAAYRLRGTFETPRFGTARSWLTLEGGEAPEEIAAASAPQRAVHAMQSAFIRVTQRLDDQGQVLVPGLTLGILGSGVADTSMRDATREPVDDAYATATEERFRTAGIMHLMAVSGGHFAVIGALIGRWCAMLRAPRPVTAACTAVGYVALAAAMMPTDSVLRATVMGQVGVCAFLAGRRGQGVSMLCVTVTGALIVDPGLARSIGFALSCAAVLGILWWAGPLGGALAAHMPGVVAEPLAVTLAAQALTLPLQTLLEPSLPLLSPLANLLTAPVVTFATLAGLGALVTSSWAPQAGYALAWLAGRGTAVMERVAAWCADAPVTALPWFEGPQAAAALLAVEGCSLLAVHAVCRVIRDARRRRGEDVVDVEGADAADARTPEPDASVGVPYRPTLAFRTRMWIDECRRLLSTSEA